MSQAEIDVKKDIKGFKFNEFYQGIYIPYVPLIISPCILQSEPEKSDWHKQQVAELKKRLNIT